jgi:hypothetical protein
MQSEEKAMTEMGRVRSMACVLVAVTPVITPFGAAPVASNADSGFIVIYVDGPNLNSQKLLLEALGVAVTQVLTLINALAIKSHLDLIAYALGLLDPLNPDPLDVINDKVVAVYGDVMGLAAEVTPTTMANASADASAEWWAWGGVHIGVADVQSQQPTPNGAGVTVAVLDTGIDCAHPKRQANIVQYPRFSACAGANPCTHDNGHGTAVMPALQRKSNLSFAQVHSLSCSQQPRPSLVFPRSNRAQG